jgi:hypothetical protein
VAHFGDIKGQELLTSCNCQILGKGLLHGVSFNIAPTIERMVLMSFLSYDSNWILITITM